MVTRVALLLAGALLIGAVSAEFHLFNLLSSSHSRQRRAEPALEITPNVVECNTCASDASSTTAIPNIDGDDGTTPRLNNDGENPTQGPGNSGEQTEGPGFSTDTSFGNDGTNEPTESVATVATEDPTTTPFVGSNDDSTPTPDDSTPTPDGNINGSEPTEETNTSEPNSSNTCDCSSYNQRLSYLFLILQNLDQRTSNVYTTAIYNALDTNNVDELSISIRVIIGMQKGDIMMSLSNFQEQMSSQLTRHTKITTSLKHILQGKDQTSTGVQLLLSSFPASRKINKNNGILIVISAMLRVNSAKSEGDVFAEIISQMQDNEGKSIFIDIFTIIWSLQQGIDTDAGSPDLYVKIQEATIYAVFGREITFNENNKDCDDSSDESDASDLDESSDSDSGSKEHKHKDSKEHKHKDSKEKKDNNNKSKESKEGKDKSKEKVKTHQQKSKPIALAKTKSKTSHLHHSKARTHQQKRKPIASAKTKSKARNSSHAKTKLHATNAKAKTKASKQGHTKAKLQNKLLVRENANKPELDARIAL